MNELKPKKKLNQLTKTATALVQYKLNYVNLIYEISAFDTLSDSENILKPINPHHIHIRINVNRDPIIVIKMRI